MPHEEHLKILNLTFDLPPYHTFLRIISILHYAHMRVLHHCLAQGCLPASWYRAHSCFGFPRLSFSPSAITMFRPGLTDV